MTTTNRPLTARQQEWLEAEPDALQGLLQKAEAEVATLRTALAAAVEAMQDAFDLHAPGMVSLESYALLSTEEVDRIWDFYERSASHKLAKAIMAARSVGVPGAAAPPRPGVAGDPQRTDSAQ